MGQQRVPQRAGIAAPFHAIYTKWRRRRATQVILSSGNEAGLLNLLTTLDTWKETEKRWILHKLSRANSDQRNSICAHWDSSRDQALGDMITTLSWVASSPPRLRLLTLLKSSRIHEAADVSVGLIADLIGFLGDDDPSIAMAADQVVASLEQTVARDHLIDYWMKTRDAAAFNAIKDWPRTLEISRKAHLLLCLKVRQHIGNLTEDQLVDLLEATADEDVDIAKGAITTLRGIVLQTGILQRLLEPGRLLGCPLHLIRLFLDVFKEQLTPEQTHVLDLVVRDLPYDLSRSPTLCKIGVRHSNCEHEVSNLIYLPDGQILVQSEWRDNTGYQIYLSLHSSGTFRKLLREEPDQRQRTLDNILSRDRNEADGALVVPLDGGHFAKWKSHGVSYGRLRTPVQPKFFKWNDGSISLSSATDGQRVVVDLRRDLATKSTFLRLWKIPVRIDPSELMPVTALGPDMPLSSQQDPQLVLSSNGKVLACVEGNEIRIWFAEHDTLVDLRSPPLKITSPYPLHDVILARNGSMLVGRNMKKVFLWRLPDGREIWNFSIQPRVQSMSLSNDGRILATNAERDVRLWSIPSGDSLGDVPVPGVQHFAPDRVIDSSLSYYVHVLAFSPNHNLLTCAGSDLYRVPRRYDTGLFFVNETQSGWLQMWEYSL